MQITLRVKNIREIQSWAPHPNIVKFTSWSSIRCPKQIAEKNLLGFLLAEGGEKEAF